MKRCLLILALLTACSGGGNDKADTMVPVDTMLDTAACEEGAACDDGDPCTTGDQCLAGVCQGEDSGCESYDCADAACNPAGGCFPPQVHEGWCLVAGVCYEAGDPSEKNQCRVCKPEVNQNELSPADMGDPCEDGNVCTEGDFCDNGFCVAGSPPTCADGIPCTVDICDEYDGCLHTPDDEACMDDKACTLDQCIPEQGGCVNTPDDDLICSDKNVCTLNDRCHNGNCISDDEHLDCDDDNQCTDEFCHDTYGCLYTFNDIDCNDGAGCTQDDKCHFGKCIGDEYWSSCPACDLSFSDHVQKIVKVGVGAGGLHGQALNVDNDLKTCAPSTNCEDGLDNSLSFAGEFINPVIAENLIAEDHTLMFVIEFVEPDYEGGEFTIKIYYVGLSTQNPDCNFNAEICTYQVSPINFDPLCGVQVSFDNSIITDTEFKAGGSGYIFPFQMTFTGGSQAEIVLYSAKVEGTITPNDAGIASFAGVMGGAVTKEDLTLLVEAVPDEYFPEDTKGLILTMIPALQDDIDLDGDGTPDGLSIGLVFETIPGFLENYYY